MSLRHLASELAEQVSSLDAKLIRTVALLFARPGALLVEYRRGARARYSTPLQLFVWTNVAFFVAVPALGIFDYRWRQPRFAAGLGAGWWADILRAKLRAAGSPEAFRLAFNAAVGGRMQASFAIIVPALALALLALYPRRRAMEHLLLAIFLAPVYMTALIGSFLGMQVVGRLHPSRATGNAMLLVLLTLAAASLALHAAFALRRAYDDAWPAAVARAAVLGAAAFYFPTFYYWFVVHVTLALL